MKIPIAKSPDAPANLRRWPASPLFVSACLALLTLAVFWPVRNCDYISFDDPEYVTSNPRVRLGLSADGVAWAFTTSHSSNWHPLTWMSHMLDATLFGPGPAGPHLVNLAFHAANAVLLFLALRALTGAHWPSAFAAALFAVHPLHVESVAWVSERKDVLSAFFWMATLWAYGRYVSDPTPFPRSRWFWTTLGCFALGLMAKPMLVTLPFVLLLLDRWPLARTVNLRWRLVEKIPLFA